MSLANRDALVRLTKEFDPNLDITVLVDLYGEANPLVEWDGTPRELMLVSAQAPAAVGKGRVVLASHEPMISAGRLQGGAPWLVDSAHRPVFLASAVTLAAAGIVPGAGTTLGTECGTITLPTAIANLPGSVTQVPECSTGSAIHENLGDANIVAILCTTQEMVR